ncbi:MAG: hypothetical protein ACJ72E_09790 [Marmoricola sp.]
MLPEKNTPPRTLSEEALAHGSPSLLVLVLGLGVATGRFLRNPHF